MTSASSMHEAGHSKLVFWDNPEVWVGEGEGGMIWENGIETCIRSYMIRIASLGSMHDTGCLGLVHWDDPEGWYGKVGGRRVQNWEHVYTHGVFMLMYGKTKEYCKVINLQLK